MELLPIKRALLSVTDKGGLDIFAKFLADNGVELVSTGGTLSFLQKAGLPVTAVSDVTGFPEIMGGRVKTLHPNIHGGILADKDNPEHLQTLAQHKIKTFDLVCVNLYNFASAVAKNLEARSAIEDIDVGGPCMLRAAAKNFHSVAVVSDPKFYDKVVASLKNNAMQLPLALRQELAMATFKTTSDYDAMIAEYLGTVRG